ncbi:MAG: CpaD family pilus assembly protein [Alphaproteobacteria bacterium]
MFRLPRSIYLAAAALAALSLAGCHSAFNGARDAWSEQSAHPITVTTHVVSGEIHVAKGATELSEEDSGNVVELAADYHARGFGKLSIAAPESTGGDKTAMQLASQMTNVALDEGVDASAVELSSYRADRADAPIVVSYSVYEATPSGCGDWSKNYAFAPLNHPTPNHGCATQNNLAVMLENPHDLIAARDQQAPDEGRRAFVLQQYRQGQVTSSQKDEQAQGAVSEVNK